MEPAKEKQLSSAHMRCCLTSWNLHHSSGLALFQRQNGSCHNALASYSRHGTQCSTPALQTVPQMR